MDRASFSSRVSRAKVFLVGERAWLFFALFSPTLLAIALDLMVRPLALVSLPAEDLSHYAAAATVGAAVWGLPLWILARLIPARDGRWGAAAKVGSGAILGTLLFFSAFAYGGQVAYRRIFSCYMAKESVRMGLMVEDEVLSRIATWNFALLAMVLGALAATALVYRLIKRASFSFARCGPVVPLLGFVLSVYCYATDRFDTSEVQAAPPDVCFLHGVVYTAKKMLSGPDALPRKLGARSPVAIPTLKIPAHRPNVVFILSESLRADTLCSTMANGCAAPFLDRIAPERRSLGKLTVEAPGTIPSCMIYWTGLPIEADSAAVYQAPTIWEMAKAAGYRTAYVSAQNLTYLDLAAYLRNAGMDYSVSAPDLGDAPDIWLGAPDERATRQTLEWLSQAPEGASSFVVVHLSNTHWPYRVDPDLQPFEPHESGLDVATGPFFNHYRNSVRLQERTVADFIGQLQRDTRWRDTVVLFVADHGEQFREHGRVFHTSNLFEEEVRVPGFLVSGEGGLLQGQEDALRSFESRRTYGQDINATLIDLLGLGDQQARIPFAALRKGRSLVEAPSLIEPIMTSATVSSISEADHAVYGARSGELLAVANESGTFHCYDLRVDPAQRAPVPNDRCRELIAAARDAYPFLAR